MKTSEKVYLPKNATIPYLWIASDADGVIVIPFPSKTLPKTYDIHIEKETGLMGCTCLGFQYTGICSHIKKLRWILKKAPRTTQAVSIEARLSSSDQWLTECNLKCLNMIKEKPMTCDEIEAILGFEKNGRPMFSAHQRVSDLFKRGLVEGNGEERKTRRGKMAIVWAIT